MDYRKGVSEPSCTYPKGFLSYPFGPLQSEAIYAWWSIFNRCRLQSGIGIHDTRPERIAVSRPGRAADLGAAAGRGLWPLRRCAGASWVVGVTVHAHLAGTVTPAVPSPAAPRPSMHQ